MIYLDNAATTKLDNNALDAMIPFMTEDYANASANYSFAFKAKKAIEDSRKVIADRIGANTDEIIYTSGGSESDNFAIKSVARAYSYKGKHIITSCVEHKAVLNACASLEKEGYEITYLGVDNKGAISLGELKKAIRKDTILISVMMANNEIGTIMPVADIGRIAHENGIIFHTDAVQTLGHMKINVNEMNIDLMSASAHKFNGPKGVGFTYVRENVKLEPLIDGGAQENGLRAGTYNTAGIVGMAVALKEAYDNLEVRDRYIMSLRDYFINRMLDEIRDVKLNGDRHNRLSNNINISLCGVEAESVLIMLDASSICASSGSACMASGHIPSHVLRAIGCSENEIKGSVRFSLSHENTSEEVDTVINVLKNIINRLRTLI